jgi:hypothetical protein
MKGATLGIAALVVLAGTTAFQQGTVSGFDDLPAGRPPAGFRFGPAPGDGARQWLVVRDGTNAVLSHSSVGRSGTELAIVENSSFANVRLSARVRFPEGANTVGLAWRYRDSENYHAVALNLKAQEVRIYRIVRGNRTRLEDEDDLELDGASWHTVKVEHQGARIRVWINGVPVANARDRSRPEPGAAGVWAPADAAAWFDDLRVEPLRDLPRDDSSDRERD